MCFTTADTIKLARHVRRRGRWMWRGGIPGPVCEDCERRRADWTWGIITFGFFMLVGEASVCISTSAV